MINEFLLKDFENARIDFKTDFDLTNKSSMKIRSKTKLFVVPKNFSQLENAAQICKNRNATYFILGGGSNTIFPDAEFDGAIISTERLNEIKIANKNPLLLVCDCGTPMATLVNFCAKNAISGLEEFAGLPGTVGGALYMNARCFEKSICEKLYETEHLEFFQNSSKIVKNRYDAAQWDYKKSPFQGEGAKNLQKIVLSATFALEQNSCEKADSIREKCKFFVNERVSKGHFKFPSAGSVFKNNRDFGKPSGKLIDEAGLKGAVCGGAEIADFHANFIINKNNATAKDVKNLAELAQKTVLEKFGLDLELEILFLE